MHFKTAALFLGFLVKSLFQLEQARMLLFCLKQEVARLEDSPELREADRPVLYRPLDLSQEC